jgi:putative oxidoreductase
MQRAKRIEISNDTAESTRSLAEPHLSPSPLPPAARAVELAGRVLLGTMFIAAGLDKLRDPQGTKDYIRSKKLPLPSMMLAGAVAQELGIGPLLTTGVAPRITAPMLAAFLVPTTFLFHDFWNQKDNGSKKAEAMHFFKNLAIIGGLATLALRDYEKTRAARQSPSPTHSGELGDASVRSNEHRPDYLDLVQFEG